MCFYSHSSGNQNQQLQVISCRISFQSNQESCSQLVTVSKIQLSHWALWGKASLQKKLNCLETALN